MRTIFTLSLFLTVLSLYSTAQTVIVYDAFNATRTVDPQKDVRENSNYNNIKWNFSLLNRGVFALTYERKINDYFSFEVGAGPTYYYDFSYFIFNESFQNSLDVWGDKNEYGPGLFLSAAPKFYPKKMDSFNGFFISPTYRYRTYNYTTTRAGWDDHLYYNSKEQTYKRSLKSTDLAFIVGFQWESLKEVVFSTYFGVGWAMKTYDNITYYDGPFLPNETVLETVNEGLPLLLIGMTVGFAF